MSAMEPSTASHPAASEPERADGIETGRTNKVKAHGDRNFETQILPGLVGSGPILPEWLRRLFRRTDTHASR
jgi:hypothetical protein